jgi:tripartite-type tricarboxylate transporter receptor subunit TctC
MLTRRHLIALATSTFMPALWDRASYAQGAWPSRPVHFIVPLAAGGPTDTNARILADQLSKIWGQQSVVENKPGAGTNLASEYVARAEPDGYTLLFATSSLAVNASLYRALSYDPMADFMPLSLVAKFPFFMFVPNSSPAKSIKEFIEYAKSRKLVMGSPGTGSAPHLAGELFQQMAGIQMTHAPYRGAAPAFNDLIPGRIDCYFGSGELLEFSRSKQVGVLGTTGGTRSPAEPEVPTIAESGVSGYAVDSWQGLFAPAKTPPDIVRKISADTNAALAVPAVKDKLANAAYASGGSSPEALREFLKTDTAKWSSVIKAADIKIE